MATLTVVRPGGHYRDSLRAYRILVDGTERGAIRAGGRLTIDLPPGDHVVRAAIDWSGSPEVRVQFGPDSSVELTVEPAAPPFKFWQAFGKTTYLGLSES